MVYEGQMFSYGIPGQPNYFLFQVIEVIRIPNKILVYTHNTDSFSIHDLNEFNVEGIRPPTEAEVLLYKKNKHYKELALEYHGIISDQPKRL